MQVVEVAGTKDARVPHDFKGGPQLFQLGPCTARASSIGNPEATMSVSMLCIPWGWMLKYFESSTPRPVVPWLSHAAMGTHLPANPPAANYTTQPYRVAERSCERATHLAREAPGPIRSATWQRYSIKVLWAPLTGQERGRKASQPSAGAPRECSQRHVQH